MDTEKREWVLDISDLAVSFSSGGRVVRGLDGMSLQLMAGEIVALVGESGSGKSVTGLTVMGLLDPLIARVDRGVVELAMAYGKRVEVTTASERRMRHIRGSEIGMIFQDSLRSLDPVMSIGAQIVEAVRAHQDMNAADARKKAMSLLSEVGLADGERLLATYPHQLSGGMGQRIMIAIALAADPRLLIADEPTTALDVTVQAQVVELISDVSRKRGMSVLFITHDLGLAAELATRVCVMYAGEVVEFGPADAVLKNPMHPYTKALIDCIPKGRDRGPLTPILGFAPDLSAGVTGCRFADRCALVIDACRVAPMPALEVALGRMSRCIRVEELTR